MRNPHKKLFTFRQKHFTGIIQRRLDYIFVSNVLQESVKKTEILNALLSDHPPISSNINEVVRSVLNFLFFFNDKISQLQKSTKHY